MKEKFKKIYANLPLGLRNEIIYIDDEYGPMTWNVVYLEILAETPIGKEAFNWLKKMKII